MSRIYLASSWRNQQQPEVLAALRAAGHLVYDFKNPPDRAGFGWSEIDPAWKDWTAENYRKSLAHPVAQAGFKSDFAAMHWADTCVLLLPCGRSAHLEAGWMAGKGKRVIVLTCDGQEPELMALLCSSVCVSIEEVIAEIHHESPRQSYPIPRPQITGEVVRALGRRLLVGALA